MATITKTTKKKKTTSVKKEDVLSASLFTPTGESAGRQKLPKEIFGQPINLQIIAQAVRVYRANQRGGSASTKTRGEVAGSTRKIYKQKGTGRARHGGIRAPIFVGGGIVFGPRPRNYSKNLPQAMRSRALVSALSYQQKEGRVVVVEKTSDVEPKTSVVAKGFVRMKIIKPVLTIIHDARSPFVKAVRNIQNVTIVPAALVTTYDIMANKTLYITKESIEILSRRVKRG